MQPLLTQTRGILLAPLIRMQTRVHLNMLTQLTKEQNKPSRLQKVLFVCDLIYIYIYIYILT